MAAPSAPGVEERTARVTFHRPTSWTSEVPADADLRVAGDGIVVTVRSRPSDNPIRDESAALIERLPGSVDGVRVVGVDPWTSAGGPGRLIEYARPDDDGIVFVSHLLVTTGRHRVDVVAERPLVDVRVTDDAVFALLDSVRVVGATPAAAAAAHPSAGAPLEDLGPATHDATPSAPPVDIPGAVEVDALAVTALQGMVGRRWNPAVLRSPGGAALIESGLVGRFGTVPPATVAILAPWEDGAEPVTLEQTQRDGTGRRLQVWIGEDAGTATVLAGGSDGSRAHIGAVTPDAALDLLASMVGIRPSWTVPFRTDRLPASLVTRRIAPQPVTDTDTDADKHTDTTSGAGEADATSSADATGGADAAPALPGDIADRDPVLARFWAAPWTISYLRRPGGAMPITVVTAAGIGSARLGRVDGDDIRFAVAAPANLYRTLARIVLGS